MEQYHNNQDNSNDEMSNINDDIEITPDNNIYYQVSNLESNLLEQIQDAEELDDLESDSNFEFSKVLNLNNQLILYNNLYSEDDEDEADLTDLIKLNDYRTRFVNCLILTFIILILSPFVFNSFGFPIDFSSSFNNIEPLIEVSLFSVIYFYGGLPFYKKIIAFLKKHQLFYIIKFINILDPAIYMYGIMAIFDANDDTISLSMVTFIDSLLLLRLLRLKIVMILK